MRLKQLVVGTNNMATTTHLFERLEPPLATAISNLKGGSRDARQKEKEKQLRRLAKDRLVLTMKRKHE
jgi:hypothetical protein